MSGGQPRRAGQGGFPGGGQGGPFSSTSSPPPAPPPQRRSEQQKPRQGKPSPAFVWRPAGRRSERGGGAPARPAAPFPPLGHTHPQRGEVDVAQTFCRRVVRHVFPLLSRLNTGFALGRKTRQSSSAAAPAWEGKVALHTRPGRKKINKKGPPTHTRKK